jgi:hypothetical protein
MKYENSVKLSLEDFLKMRDKCTEYENFVNDILDCAYGYLGNDGEMYFNGSKICETMEKYAFAKYTVRKAQLKAKLDKKD